MEAMKEVFALLKKNHETISVAESCTGGGLANEISKIPGASEIFLGSATTYSNEAKERVLSIPKEILMRHGAVSEEVAILMAKNCKALFNSTWSLSTTGIAGPSGGTTKKPVGLVWIGIAGPTKAFAKRFEFSQISRLKHRQRTIEAALKLLLFNS